jgi:hypothetical protein
MLFSDIAFRYIDPAMQTLWKNEEKICKEEAKSFGWAVIEAKTPPSGSLAIECALAKGVTQFMVKGSDHPMSEASFARAFPRANTGGY